MVVKQAEQKNGQREWYENKITHQSSSLDLCLVLAQSRTVAIILFILQFAHSLARVDTSISALPQAFGFSSLTCACSSNFSNLLNKLLRS